MKSIIVELVDLLSRFIEIEAGQITVHVDRRTMHDAFAQVQCYFQLITD